MSLVWIAFFLSSHSTFFFFSFFFSDLQNSLVFPELYHLISYRYFKCLLWFHGLSFCTVKSVFWEVEVSSSSAVALVYVLLRSRGSFFQPALLTRREERVLQCALAASLIPKCAVCVCGRVCVDFYTFLKSSYKYFKKDYSSYTEFKCNLSYLPPLVSELYILFCVSMPAPILPFYGYCSFSNSP